MSSLMQVSSSPHIRAKDSTRSIMLDVIIALMPALAVSTVVFGLRSLLLTGVTVAFCVFFEFLSRRIMKRPQTVGDLSAVVTGILLAYNLPVNLPLWMTAVGAFFAIVVAKQAFGGIGMNFINPALVSRVVLQISFPQEMTGFAVRSSIFTNDLFAKADLISAATPLNTVKYGGAIPTYWQQFIGLKAGAIGEVSVLALLLGLAWLLYRGIIDLSIPLSFMGATMVFVAIFGKDPLYHLMAGGLVLGAIFMATDYVTSPVNLKGKIIFGLGCGLITGLIRIFGSMNEGVSYSILLMNILTPHINNLTLGYPRRKAKSAKGGASV